MCPGTSVARLELERDLPWLDADSQQARDVERFRWFSDGYVALDPSVPNRVIDMRYSLVPNEIDPLWGVDLDPGCAAGSPCALRDGPRRPPRAARGVLEIADGGRLQWLGLRGIPIQARKENDK